MNSKQYTAPEGQNFIIKIDINTIINKIDDVINIPTIISYYAKLIKRNKAKTKLSIAIFLYDV